jgi:hypothetical protein
MNKFSLLLAALCVSLNAQEAKPADSKAAAPAPEVKLSGGAKSEQKIYNVELWACKSMAEFINFQKNMQVLTVQIEELKRLKGLLEIARTTPEKNALGHDIAAKEAKLIGDIESVQKLYGGYNPLARPGQFIQTKVAVLTPISNEEFTKLSSSSDFKPDSVIPVEDKRFLVRDTVSGQIEVDTFYMSLRRINEFRNQLKQYVELQPQLVKEDDKKKVEKIIKDIQDELNKSLDEFKKARGFDFTPEIAALASEGKLVIQITEEEKKTLEAKNAPTPAPSTPPAPAAPAAPAGDKK